MIQLQKSELEKTLLHIAGFNEKGQIVSGLLSEEITLGMKRRIQKMHKDLVASYQEFIKHKEEVEKVCGEDKEKLEAELKVLLEETINLNHDKLSMAMIESVKSKNNYDFDLLEKIAE